VDVRKDTTLGNGNVAQELVQLLIVSDGKLEMTGDDTGLLVVTGSVASELENLSSQVLQDSSQVDGGASTDTLSVVALSQETVDTTNGERETSLGRTTVAKKKMVSTYSRVKSGCGPRRTRREHPGYTYDWAFLEPPEALPPDLPPPVILKVMGFEKVERKSGWL
jgi:hypothetical protein